MDTSRYSTPPSCNNYSRAPLHTTDVGGKVEDSSRQEAAALPISSLPASDEIRSEGIGGVHQSQCSSAFNRASYDMVQSFDSF